MKLFHTVGANLWRTHKGDLKKTRQNIAKDPSMNSCPSMFFLSTYEQLFYMSPSD